MKSLKSSKVFEVLGRKRIIIAFIILIIILSITTVSFIIKAVKDNNNNKGETITYTENSLVNYKVFLKENEFFEEKYLEEGKQYIASIINYVNAAFNYSLDSSKASENYRYTYKIVAETDIEDSGNKNSIYSFSEELVPERTLTAYDTSDLLISENITIDYNKYNDIIKDFIAVYGLTEITPTLTINMYVAVDGITTNTSTPVASLVIPLSTKTVAIDISSNSVNATQTNVYKEIANKNNLYIAILTFTLTAMIGIELYTFINDTKDEVTIYKMKIKKILLNYDSYIQKVDNCFDYEGYQQVEMQTFEDLLQVRDTISEPILMLETIKDKETDFIIPTKGQVIYIYRLKLDDLKKNEKGKKN